MGNANINQFLDNDPEVLNIVSWSSKRVVGPVLGYITDATAKVQYRVDNEGIYSIDLYQGATLVTTQEASLTPSYIFTFSSLQANTHYTFKFFRKVGMQRVAIPAGDGAFRTSPQEGQGVKFSFGYGSCVRNGYDAVQSSWQQVKNISLDPAVDPLTQNPPLDLRFFIHAGDTFYFYDDVAVEDAALMNSSELVSTARAANLSSRLNANFLDMAKRVPTCGVWDDHDFRFNDKDSAGFTYKHLSKQAFLEYWANPTPFTSAYGLSSRMTYGNVDIYLLDGRYNRVHSSNQLFSTAQCDFIVQDMESRGPNRLPILLSGSTWNNTRGGDNAHYGDETYKTERETFYGKLNALIADNKIKGLIFLSGDVHVHEIYQVELASTNPCVAPEIVCSPMGPNSGLSSAPSITGERKVGLASNNGQVGFASLHINTTSANPNNWTVTVNYRKNDGVVFYSKRYTLTNNQFIF
jgi:phosphodiesterase/alkaline phosphatase D-like protein